MRIRGLEAPTRDRKPSGSLKGGAGCARGREGNGGVVWTSEIRLGVTQVTDRRGGEPAGAERQGERERERRDADAHPAGSPEALLADRMERLRGSCHLEHLGPGATS